MNIIRYQETGGAIAYAAQQPDGKAFKIEGDIFRQPQVTKTEAKVGKLLAPLAPPAIFCIGLNYRRHAEEESEEHGSRL